MKKILDNGNISSILLLLMIGVIFGAWHGTEFINSKFASLKIQQIPRASVAEVATSSNDIYPVWVKQKAVLQTEMVASSNVDELFQNRDLVEPVKAVAAPEVDYRSLVYAAASLQAIGDNGAVLNGVFYPVGARLNGVTITRPDGVSVIPTLVSVRPGKVTVKIESHSVDLFLQGRESVI